MDRLAWSGARTRFPFAALSIALALTGCGDDDTPTTDAGPGDSGMVINLDAGTDAGTTPVDGGIDAGNANACRGYGADCTGERPCIGRGLECLEEFNFPLANGETVRDLPAGSATMGAYFQGGYCTPARPPAVTGGAPLCDPTNDMDPTCGECGSCIDFGLGAMCTANCEPNGTDNSTCRDGSFCALTAEVCIPVGCTTDEECRIERLDENGVPGLQSPRDCMESPNTCDADCYCGEVFCGADDMDDCDCGMIAECTGDAMNSDPLVYNDDPALGCNMDTFECRRPGNPDAEAGDPCTESSDCETDGRCLDEETFEAFEGGYCIKDRCDLAGRECGSNAICANLQSDTDPFFACVGSCNVAEGHNAADPSEWLTNNGSCESDSHACLFDRTNNSGFCFPGEFNDVTENNVGGACDDASDCWSPFGVGRCLTERNGFDNGYCTVNDCAAPGLPADICGEGNSCVTFDPMTNFALCLQGCENASECGAGLGCLALQTGATEKFCFSGCSEDADCRAGESCNGATAMSLGTCE